MSAALLGAAIAFPLGVIGSHQFIDVPTSSTFHADIDAIRDAGVTTGCAAGKYCPKDFVTREQMAAFLNRLGALQAGKTPVVNADKVDGKDEVLGAGNIVIRQNGVWVADYGDLHYSAGVTEIRGDTSALVMIDLQEPGTIGGQAYGFQSVQVCWHASNFASINSMAVIQDVGSPIAEDETGHPLNFPDCYTVSDATPSAPAGGTKLRVNVGLGAVGVARVGDVITTWVPVP